LQDVSDAVILAGILFGAMLPFMFAALTMVSVGKAAVRLQPIQLCLCAPQGFSRGRCGPRITGATVTWRG
jgi:hypothetical protein